jgi:hypothetical protein
MLGLADACLEALFVREKATKTKRGTGGGDDEGRQEACLPPPLRRPLRLARNVGQREAATALQGLALLEFEAASCSSGERAELLSELAEAAAGSVSSSSSSSPSSSSSSLSSSFDLGHLQLLPAAAAARVLWAATATGAALSPVAASALLESSAAEVEGGTVGGGGGGDRGRACYLEAAAEEILKVVQRGGGGTAAAAAKIRWWERVEPALLARAFGPEVAEAAVGGLEELEDEVEDESFLRESRTKCSNRKF